jgi:hypothetical protein
MASQADDMLSVEPSTRLAERASPRGGCNLRTSAHRGKIIWQACGVTDCFARHCKLSEQRRTLGINEESGVWGSQARWSLGSKSGTPRIRFEIRQL